MVGSTYLSWKLEDVFADADLPAELYLLLEGRYVAFKKGGDQLSKIMYDRMELKKVDNIFIKASDEAVFRQWLKKIKNDQIDETKLSPELQSARDETKRKIKDIFLENHPNEVVKKTLVTSEKLVTELMKFPFASKPLQQLQGQSRGTVDHSVNVSILSVYLAMNMGYTHILILRHLASGALLHDVGKVQYLKNSDGSVNDSISEEQMERKHPEMGIALIDSDETVSKEVKMIIAQHHEYHDGTGYPRGLKGREIYDLAKIVALANTFDNLVSQAQGPLEQRQRFAVEQLKGPLAYRFDPSKLQKAIKILSLGV